MPVLSVSRDNVKPSGTKRVASLISIVCKIGIICNYRVYGAAANAHCERPYQGELRRMVVVEDRLLRKPKLVVGMAVAACHPSRSGGRGNDLSDALCANHDMDTSRLRLLNSNCVERAVTARASSSSIKAYAGLRSRPPPEAMLRFSQAADISGRFE
jgi:hypothetical protein